MKALKIFLGLTATAAFTYGASALTSDGAYKVNRASKVNRDHAVGTKLYDAQQFGVKGQWSYATHGGAVGAVNLDDHEGNDVKLPSGAVITNCVINVVTTPTTAASGRLALNSKAVGDLKAFTAAASYTTTAPLVCVPDGQVANMIKLASETTLQAQIDTGAMTAGKIDVFVEYILSE